MVEGLVATDAGARRLVLWTGALVLALTAIRLLLAAATELSGNEAILWLTSREPQLGATTIQPMASWWVWAGRTLFGETEFAVRVLGVLAMVPVSWLTFRTHAILFHNEHHAALGVLWLHATLFVTVGAVIMSPATPLVLFWMIAIFGLAKLLQSDDGRWWYAVGLATGLALLTDYISAFLVAGVILWLIFAPALRPWLLRFEFYVALAIAVLVFLPNVVWNAENDWAAFAAQLDLFERDRFRPHFLLQFIGSQFGLLTPVIFVFAGLGLGLAVWRGATRQDANWLLVAVMTAPLLADLFEYGLHHRINVDWTAMIVPLAMIAAIEFAYIPRPPGWRRQVAASARHIAPLIGFAFAAFVYVQGVFDFVPDRGTRDPVAALKGWNGLAADVDIAAETVDASYVVTTDAELAALLIFYGNAEKPVVALAERRRLERFTDPSPATFAGTGLYVARADKNRVEDLRPLFGSIEETARIERRRPGGIIEEVNLYLLGEPRIMPPLVPED